MIAVILAVLLAMPVSALELTAPEVPDRAEKFMPDDPGNFAEGLLEVLRDALLAVRPDLKDAASVCLSVTAMVMAVSLLRALPGTSEKTVDLAGCTGIALLLLKSSKSLIKLAITTVTDISEYGKLLLPVMTAAMAAQGGITSSAALYAGTALFDALLTSAISRMLTPMIYLYLMISRLHLLHILL